MIISDSTWFDIMGIPLRDRDVENIKIDGLPECGYLLSLQMFLCSELSLWNINSDG